MQTIKEKNNWHPNQEVQFLSILPAENYRQVYPAADHQKTRNIYKKSFTRNGRAFN